MTLTPEHGEYSKGKSKNYRWLYVGSAHKRECLAPQQEAGSGCMDAQFTAPFCLLHILPFPQLFSLLFFSKEISSKFLQAFRPYKSQNTLYYCTMFYVFAISAQFRGCLVTVFIGNEAQTLENVEISTKIYIFSLSKSIMSSTLDS